MEDKIVTKDDWDIEGMPEQTDSFVLDRSFTSKQMDALRHGNIPKEMEDKWFWYMEGDTLYAHRSWTGICIYIIEFRPDDQHRVTVNRNTDQYSCPSIEEDKKQLNNLLDWWSQTPYDHYGEWISETVDAINKSKND